MKVGGLALLLGCLGAVVASHTVRAAAAAEDEAREDVSGSTSETAVEKAAVEQQPSRALQIVSEISLGLGENNLVRDGAGNIGPKHTATNGIEFSWIKLPNGNFRVVKTAVHGPEPSTSCPLTLPLPPNDNDNAKKGVAYIRVKMEIATLQYGPNWNKAVRVRSFKNCRGQDLPVGTPLGFEYSHVLYTVLQAVPSEGCGTGTGIDIRRPQCVCSSAECNGCRGVAFFKFEWKGSKSVPESDRQQCQVSGDRAQVAADEAYMEQFFSQVAGDSTTAVLGQSELDQFWDDMGVTTSDGDSLSDDDKTTLFNYFANLETDDDDGIDQSEFGKLATDIQENLFSQDQMDAYKVRRACEDNSDLIGCGTCEL